MVVTNARSQVLTCLALAYVLEGDRGLQAMGCIAKLREASSKGSAKDHQISFLALQVSQRSSDRVTLPSTSRWNMSFVFGTPVFDVAE